MNDIRLVATDMDGTFLYYYNETHPDNIEAVRRCRERGIIFCACTGRYFANSHRMMQRFGMDSKAVFCNGASVADINTGELKYNSLLPADVLRQAVLFGTENGAEVTVCGHEGLYTYSHDGRTELQLPEQDFGFFQVVYDMDELLQLSAPIAQKVFMNLDISQYEDDLNDSLRHTAGAEITTAHKGYIEIMAPGVTKATGLSRLAESYGVAPEQVMAFGDNINDMSMLQWAGVGVAMGNGDERLKAVADITAPPSSEGGVAAVLNRMLFNND